MHKIIPKILPKLTVKTTCIVHSKVFHGGHGVAHFAYLVWIICEWHGVGSLFEAAVIGTSMVSIMGGGEA